MWLACVTDSTGLCSREIELNENFELSLSVDILLLEEKVQTSIQLNFSKTQASQVCNKAGMWFAYRITG